jgi:hypothetical protein
MDGFFFGKNIEITQGYVSDWKMYADFTEKNGLRGWVEISQGFLKEAFREIRGFHACPGSAQHDRGNPRTRSSRLSSCKISGKS